MELVVKIAGQEGGEADEAAKRHGVDQAEGPAVFLEQAGNVLAERGVGREVRRFLGIHGHHHGGHSHAHGGKAIHRLPAKILSQSGRQQCGYQIGRAHV